MAVRVAVSIGHLRRAAGRVHVARIATRLLRAGAIGACVAWGACTDGAPTPDRERPEAGGVAITDSASDIDTAAGAVRADGIVTTAAAASDSIAITIAFRRGEQLDVVERMVPPGEPLRAALEALLAGPTAAERAAGIESWFSASTRAMLHTVTVDHGLAVVDFEDFSRIIPNASSSFGSTMLLAELNATVFANTDATAVEYRFDGSCHAFGEWLQRGCIRYDRHDAGTPEAAAIGQARSGGPTHAARRDAGDPMCRAFLTRSFRRVTTPDSESGRMDPDAAGARDRVPRAANEAAGESLELEDLLALLVESVHDYAIFALDPTGHVLTWNRGAQRFKGYQVHEIIGRHFSVFYPPDQIAAGKPEYELVVATEEGRFEEEGWRIRKDGTRFWANVVITALRDASGALVGFAIVTRDLTERRAAEQQALEDARRVATAEAANRTKSEFLATMSHELRTPLNAISGYVDLLLLDIRGPINDQQRADLHRVRRSHKHLLAIINDLLNFSRLEAGRVMYDIAPVRIAEVFAAVRTMIEPLAMTSRIHLDWAECDDDVMGLADEAKVEQVLINLLTNALKFTPAGGTVSLACHPAGDHIAVTVTDTGIGIAAEKLESIFEPFVQIGRSLSSAHEGTGLGLAISRDLARAMNGELSVRSQTGEGSTFLLTLPSADGAATADR